MKMYFSGPSDHFSKVLLVLFLIGSAITVTNASCVAVQVCLDTWISSTRTCGDVSQWHTCLVNADYLQHEVCAPYSMRDLQSIVENLVAQCQPPPSCTEYVDIKRCTYTYHQIPAADITCSDLDDLEDCLVRANYEVLPTYPRCGSVAIELIELKETIEGITCAIVDQHHRTPECIHIELCRQTASDVLSDPVATYIQVCEAMYEVAVCMSNPGYRTCYSDRHLPKIDDVHSDSREMCKEYFTWPDNPCTGGSNGGCVDGCVPHDGQKYECIPPQCKTGYILREWNTTCKHAPDHPCANMTQSGCEHLCLPVGQTDYVCACPANKGLSHDGKSCVHPCNSTSHGHCDHTCVPLSSSNYECRCDVGYNLMSDGRNCEKISPCSTPGQGGCQQSCVPYDDGEYVCSCHKGYFLTDNERDCEQAPAGSPCAEHSNGGCEQRCIPTSASEYHCLCMSGYSLDGNNRNCTMDKNATCDDVAACRETYRNSTKLCSDRFELNTCLVNAKYWKLDICDNWSMSSLQGLVEYLLGQCEPPPTCREYADVRQCTDIYIKIPTDDRRCSDLENLEACLEQANYELLPTYPRCESVKLALIELKETVDGIICPIIREHHMTPECIHIEHCRETALEVISDPLMTDIQICVALYEAEVCMSNPGYRTCYSDKHLPKVDDAYSLYQENCKDTFTWPVNPCSESSQGGCVERCVPHNGLKYECIPPRCKTGYILREWNVTCKHAPDHACFSMSQGGCEHMCLPVGHSGYVCGCPAHQLLADDGKSCLHTCNMATNGGCEHICVSLSESNYECRCNSGYTLKSDGHNCEINSPCSTSCQQTCKPYSDGGHMCSCHLGYFLTNNERDCEQAPAGSPCAESSNGGCEQRCLPTSGARYKCLCVSGYSLANNNRNCTKGENPCYTESQGGCMQSCAAGTGKTYNCTCWPGFSLDSNGIDCHEVTAAPIAIVQETTAGSPPSLVSSMRWFVVQLICISAWLCVVYSDG